MHPPQLPELQKPPVALHWPSEVQGTQAPPLQIWFPHDVGGVDEFSQAPAPLHALVWTELPVHSAPQGSVDIWQTPPAAQLPV
jgi:hypothetical protein